MAPSVFAVMVVFIIATLVWAWTADHRSPRPYNGATYCEDLWAGHPQSLPPGLAVDCAAPSNAA